MMCEQITRILLLLICLASMACGQRGPLYLPEEPQADPQDTPQGTP